MENNTFTPDYSRIKRRVIIKLIAEIAVAFVLIILYALALGTGALYRNPVASDLTSITVGCYFAHLILSIFFIIMAFRSTIKKITIEENGFTVNGLKYRSDFDPDNMKGVGLNFTGGIIPFIIPAAGINIVISATGTPDHPVRKTVWTGPVNDKEAVKLRNDILAFLKPYFDKINDEHYEKVKDAIASKPIKVTINKDKFRSGTILISILFGIAVFLMIYGALTSFDFIIIAIILLAAAALFGYIWIRFLVKQNRCIKSVVTEVELSDTAVITDGEVYNLKDTKIDMFYISKKPADIETSLRCAPPAKETPMGMFIELSDSQKTNRYWIGSQLDSESSGVVILLKYAKRLQEEMKAL